MLYQIPKLFDNLVRFPRWGIDRILHQLNGLSTDVQCNDVGSVKNKVVQLRMVVQTITTTDNKLEIKNTSTADIHADIDLAKEHL